MKLLAYTGELNNLCWRPFGEILMEWKKEFMQKIWHSHNWYNSSWSVRWDFSTFPLSCGDRGLIYTCRILFIECGFRNSELSVGLVHSATDLGIFKYCPFVAYPERIPDFVLAHVWPPISRLQNITTCPGGSDIPTKSETAKDVYLGYFSDCFVYSTRSESAGLVSAVLIDW